MSDQLVSVFAELSPPYATVVADPPWRFDAPASTKADATAHYATASTTDLCRLPVASLAATDAYLWLWCVNAMMEDAYQVVRSWGFSPLTLVTWCKEGRPGVGHYLRNNTEHVIVARRGQPPTPADKPLSTWYVWPRRRHSAKPPAFGDLVERVSPGPYVELFARAPRLGWDSWGRGYELGGPAFDGLDGGDSGWSTP